MISPTMVKGPILVKAKKIGESDDGYYLEFELNEFQKMQFITDLILAHSTNGKLELNNDDDKIKQMKLLREIVNDNPQMEDDLKQKYLSLILKLADR